MLITHTGLLEMESPKLRLAKGPTVHLQTLMWGWKRKNNLYSCAQYFFYSCAHDIYMQEHRTDFFSTNDIHVFKCTSVYMYVRIYRWWWSIRAFGQIPYSLGWYGVDLPSEQWHCAGTTSELENIGFLLVSQSIFKEGMTMFLKGVTQERKKEK